MYNTFIVIENASNETSGANYTKVHGVYTNYRLAMNEWRRLVNKVYTMDETCKCDNVSTRQSPGYFYQYDVDCEVANHLLIRIVTQPFVDDDGSTSNVMLATRRVRLFDTEQWVDVTCESEMSRISPDGGETFYHEEDAYMDTLVAATCPDEVFYNYTHEALTMYVNVKFYDWVEE